MTALLGVTLFVATLAGCGASAPEAGGSPAGGRDAAARAAPLVAALGERLAGASDASPPAPPGWPADLGFHPGARAESVELGAVLEDEGGGRHSVVRRLDRLALRGAAEPATVDGASFGFRDVVRASGAVTTSDPGGAAPRTVRRELLERATLDLAGADGHALHVRDVSLVHARHEGDAPCRARYTLSEGDGATLVLDQDGCPSATVAGPLVLVTSPTLSVEGTLVLDGEPRAVAGRGWMRRAWGAPPVPGGAVVFDRLVLELDGLGLVDAVRSKRRSGRGPKSTTGSLRPVSVAGTAAGIAAGTGTGAGVELARAEWRDGAADGGEELDGEEVDGERAVPSAWTLDVPASGIDVVLTPVIEVPVTDDAFGAAWRGGVVASGTHAGIGFVEFRVLGERVSGPSPDGDS